ncbi:hypothetical protein NESM_000784600 [Novymonas esmeraldas]|uniref:Uncharacterized protein n=1 Tax=Novymonas esmeraldas TaxID=1808958 RepID=A0AAW0EXG6_9TRYP
MPVFPLLLAPDRVTDAARAGAEMTLNGLVARPRRSPPPHSATDAPVPRGRDASQPRQAPPPQGRSPVHAPASAPVPTAEPPTLRRMGGEQSSESDSSASTAASSRSPAGRVGGGSVSGQQRRGGMGRVAPPGESHQRMEARSQEHSLRLPQPTVQGGDGGAAAEAVSGDGTTQPLYSMEQGEASDRRLFASLRRRIRRERRHEGSSSSTSLATLSRGSDSGTASGAQQRGRDNRHERAQSPRRRHRRSLSASLTHPSVHTPQSLVAAADGAAVRRRGSGDRSHGSTSASPPRPRPRRDQSNSTSFGSVRSGQNVTSAPGAIRRATPSGAVEGPPADITILVASQGVQLTTSRDALRRQALRSASSTSVRNARSSSLHSDQVLGAGSVTPLGSTPHTVPAITRTSSRNSSAALQNRQPDVHLSEAESSLPSARGSCGTAPATVALAAVALWQLPVLSTVTDGDVTQPTQRHYLPSLSSASTSCPQRPPARDDRDDAVTSGTDSSITVAARPHHRSASLVQPLPRKPDTHTEALSPATPNPLTSSGDNAETHGADDEEEGEEAEEDDDDDLENRSRVSGMSDRSGSHSESATLHDDLLSLSLLSPRSHGGAASSPRTLSQAATASSYPAHQSFFSGASLSDAAPGVPSVGASASRSVSLLQPRVAASGSRTSLLHLHRRGSTLLTGSVGDSIVLADVSQYGAYTFASPLNGHLFSSPTRPHPPSQLPPPLPPPRRAGADQESLVLLSWERFGLGDAVGGRLAAAAVEEPASLPPSPRSDSIAEVTAASSTEAPRAPSELSAGRRRQSAPRPPETRVHLPVAKPGVVLLNHIHNEPPHGELYRLLRVYHREPLHQFPQALRGPLLAVRMTESAAEEDEEIDNAVHERERGARETPLQAGGRRDGRPHPRRVSAAAAPTVAVSASHPRELYSRLVNDPVDSAVEVVRAAPAAASSASSATSLDAASGAHRSVLNGFYGLDSTPFHTTAEVVANGFYSAEARACKSRQHESHYRAAVEEYGESSYYRLDTVPDSAAPGGGDADFITWANTSADASVGEGEALHDRMRLPAVNPTPCTSAGSAPSLRRLSASVSASLQTAPPVLSADLSVDTARHSAVELTRSCAAPPPQNLFPLPRVPRPISADASAWGYYRSDAESRAAAPFATHTQRQLRDHHVSSRTVVGDRDADEVWSGAGESDGSQHHRATRENNDGPGATTSRRMSGVSGLVPPPRASHAPPSSSGSGYVLYPRGQVLVEDLHASTDYSPMPRLHA